MKKKLPVGIENFSKIIEQDFYYVDKTEFISDLLHNWGEVNLITRPRRFGKSLNMSMLKAFFEIGSNKGLFDGLNISKEKELCEKYLGKYPVISITLKDVAGLSYRDASFSLREIIGREANRFSFLENSNKLLPGEIDSYKALIHVENGLFTMPDAVLISSLQTLSLLLAKHYEKEVIILIDEYDVPLDKAFQGGYYAEMISLLRNMFSKALKGNDSLQFAVITGCLRISKESIFTGLNNLNVMTITDEYFNNSFGFTKDEVWDLLKYYNLEEASDTVREWYDGYCFGQIQVYCPWDVIKYCQALLKNREAVPENYWANTSGNDMVRRFIHLSNPQTKQEIEGLIRGEVIIKSIKQELTYQEIDAYIDNLWSVLFTTGYLTQRGRVNGNQFRLAIPNLEIKELFIMQIKTWFDETVRADSPKLRVLCSAFVDRDIEKIENLLNGYLWDSISIRDTAVRNDRKENFYHGMLLGLLQYEEDWRIRSNEESGTGYSDILIETRDRIGIVIEIKYAKDNLLEAECVRALKQIEEKQYEDKLIKDGMKKVIKYGIAFYKKCCKVMFW